MPERLNYAMLLEIGDERSARSEIINCIEKVFSIYIIYRYTLVLMNHGIPEMCWNFPEAEGNIFRSLSDDEMIFIYYNDPGGLGGPIIRISKTKASAIYTISFPSITMLARPHEVSNLIISLYSEIVNMMRVHCVVIVGGEVEIDENDQSVNDVLRSASRWDSLVEYLCCDKKDISQLTNFVLVQEDATSALFRRSHAAASSLRR